MHRYDGYDDGAAPDPSIRAADADREATADRLRQDHTEGRIDVTEFQDRLDRTYQAKTVGELQQLVSDLPRDRQPGHDRRPRLRRLWMSAWIPLVFLIVAVSALGGHHHHAGLWVLIPLFFVARFLLWGYRPWHTRQSQGWHSSTR